MSQGGGLVGPETEVGFTLTKIGIFKCTISILLLDKK